MVAFYWFLLYKVIPFFYQSKDSRVTTCLSLDLYSTLVYLSLTARDALISKPYCKCTKTTMKKV